MRVYAVSARMPDRFAGANMCSGHPNGISLLNLFKTLNITPDYGILYESTRERGDPWFQFEAKITFHQQ